MGGSVTHRPGGLWWLGVADMLIMVLSACLPPILSDTGVAPDSGDSADTSDSGDPIDGDGDGDGFVADDCDNADSATHPGASEKLDFKDQDCDEITVETVTDHVGAVSHAGVGFVLSISTFAEMGAGGPEVAAGIIRDGVSSVQVARVDDLRSDLTGGTALTHTGAKSFGFDLLAQDLDGDGVTDLAIGDPVMGAYIFAAGSLLGPAGSSLNTDTFPTLQDRVGGGSVGFASAVIGQTFAVTHSGGAGNSVYLLDAGTLLTTANSGLVGGGVIVSTETASGFGANLAGLKVDGDLVADLIVGAPFGAALKGQVFLFDGTAVSQGAPILTEEDADCTLTGEKVSLRLGGGAIPARDATGDGTDDLLLATYATGGDAEERTWYLVPGGPFCGTQTIENAAFAVIRGTRPYVLDAGLDVSLLSATSADLDEDGINELIAGSPSETRGTVYIFAGHTFATRGTYELSDASAGLVGQVPDDIFGAVVGVGGSVGDGALLISAPGQEQGTFWSVDLAF